MRILMLTQWFQPEPTFKGLSFAKALKEKGHQVEILTGFPNYPKGKIYPNYRLKFCQRELMDDIRVNRVPLYPNRNKSALRSAINFLSFAISSFMLGPWLVRRPDVIYVYNLVTLAPVAFLFRFLFGSKVVIDVLDVWPEAVDSSNKLNNKTALYILNKICKWAYRKADKLVVISPGFRRALIERGVSPEKIEVIYNWCDESGISRKIVRSDLIANFFKAEKFNILYAGAMGPAQGLDTILDCAKICTKKLPDIQFILIGDGVDKPCLEKRANEMRLNNVTFLPPRPSNLMCELYDIADALIVHLKEHPLFRITIPSKTQAYLYIGKPIIMAVCGDAEALVKQACAGVVCKPDDPLDMMKAIKTLIDMTKDERLAMGKRGQDYYTKNLSFGSGVDKFEKVFLSCLQPSKEGKKNSLIILDK